MQELLQQIADQQAEMIQQQQQQVQQQQSESQSPEGEITIKIVAPDGKVLMESTLAEMKQRSQSGEIVVDANGVGTTKGFNNA